MAPDSRKHVHHLQLTDEGAPDIPGGHNYIYLPPPSDPAYTLRISIEGTSSVCREGTLWLNIPENGEKFERSKYRPYKLNPDFNRTINIDIPITSAGAFSFYTTYTPLPEFSTKTVSAPTPATTPVYYIDVEPRLSLNGKTLPIDALAMFSVISKLMGKNPQDWDRHMKGIGERGYNMVHFTPLNKRGASNSPYSIFDQLGFDEDFFPKGESDIAELLDRAEKQFGLLGLTDVVLNHTAHNSEWLEEHPESGYNIETAPWLESAELLDEALLKFTTRLAPLGLPTTLKNTDDLSKIMDSVRSHVIDELRLWEFYIVDAKRDSAAVLETWRAGNESLGSTSANLDSAKDWPLKQQADWVLGNALSGNDCLGERYRRQVVTDRGAALLSAIVGPFSQSPNEDLAHNTIHNIINAVNLPFYGEYNDDVETVIDQVFNRIKYLRLDDHGPKMGEINEKSPLTEPYFTRLPENKRTKGHNRKARALVNNGWIWAADAMKDHAGPSSKAYLRREVIVWGDCVKLRYGKGPEDSPYLWDRMAQYCRLMAKYFAGFRIDNCHSTPLHVAEYMLDQARTVRPNLAVFAELFTGSEATDFVFVQRLGISALIREAMQAGSTAELSRLVHMHMGMPIGSLVLDEISGADSSEGGNGPREIVHRIRQSNVHALFCDCTHDNEPPAQKRDARDTLPTAALVSMCACATGSVMGYDEIYPRYVNLVTESRQYSSASSDGSVKEPAGDGGIGGIKKILNEIHVEMGKQGYDETYLDHKDQYITVHRVDPATRKGYFAIAHTAFPGYGTARGNFDPVHLQGTRAKLVGGWALEVDASEEATSKVLKDGSLLKGLPSKTKLIEGINVTNESGNATITIPESFPPGSIALFETAVPAAEHSDGLDQFVTSGARSAFKDCTLRHLNFILYRCDAEERDTSEGKDGVYDVPGHGPLVYAGLQGWYSVIKDIVRTNELGHPLCQHLRDGPWPMDYTASRLEKLSKLKDYEALTGPAKWLRSRFDAIRNIPSFLLPRYFAMVIQTAYNAATDRAIEQMSDDIRNGPKFLKELALVSIQVSGYSTSGSLWPQTIVPSLAAGLPHFATDWARCWGRDVFISLRGLLLGTGRFANAKEHILAFGSVLKHGMIPNLLGSGKITRYNSRDSIWFYLQSVQDYTNMVPDGIKLLQEHVKRRYLPYDDTWFPWDDPRAYSKSSTIEDIIQEAMQRHAEGMSFREANAGPGIDMQMSDEGFNIKINVDWKTGIIFGGNQANCGTWMDKMGESTKAGNKGVPGTPRDGAAVEITGMLHSTLVWLDKLHSSGQYKYDGVDVKEQNGKITWKDWASRIKDHFERCYYVPTDPKEDGSFDVNPKMINRRGIYKDLYLSGKEYEDYQLRPNFPIAMTVAPDLFNPEHALNALQAADQNLRKRYGMATLDPADLNYRPNYINSDDSGDFATSKGRNYHSGPEWLWPLGYFLRALLHFDLKRRKTTEEKVESYQQVTRRMAGCMQMIRNTPWAGLTELTNENGSFCGDSCPTQAWSAGCLIDVFHDAQHLPSGKSSAANGP